MKNTLLLEKMSEALKVELPYCPTDIKAVNEQIEKGTHYGGCDELQIEWAELSTMPRVWPCFALVHNFDKWRDGFDHTHPIILFVFSNVS
mgnify:CR=1 FL=1